MTNETYGRGQIEWALWRSFAPVGFKTTDVPSKFRTRIKRLLDIDRELDLADVEDPPGAEKAFVKPSSLGDEFPYSPCDVFALGVALDLLDSGFKQRDVVFLMRYLRPDLDDFYPVIADYPSLTAKQLHREKDYPELPAFTKKKISMADPRLFVVVKLVELTEASLVPAMNSNSWPVFFEPMFCRGVEALAEEMFDTMPTRRRSATILELTATAQVINKCLREAPVKRRGRPKEKG